MLELFGTIANDKINRYNEKITIGALVGAYQSQWRDIFPMTVNHDNTRLIGYSRLSGIYLEPGATYLTNQSFMPETEAEKSFVNQTICKQISANRLQKNQELYDQLLSQLKDFLSGNYALSYSNGIVVIDEGIVSRSCPTLWSMRDQDGLIPLEHLTPVMPGVFLCEGLLLFAHAYFRRSLHRGNSLNIPFLRRLQELAPHAKIALDPDMIGLPGTQSEMREYAYWWGPKFDDDLSKIPLGLTRHENENYDALMSPIIRTECGWHIQDGSRTFECEEVTDVKNINVGTDLYGCRYVHSMLSENNIPCHLDGAIRAYDDEKMLLRLECNLDHAERNTTYTKLWRIDGALPISAWKELITHYYRDNPLIGEYFCDERYHNLSRNDSKLTGSENSSSATESYTKYIPVDFSPKDGVRLQITISNQEDINSDYDIFIRPLNYTLPGESIKAIEYESITLVKYLSEKHLRVRVPYCALLAFNDLSINFPLFVCHSADAANTIISSILDFCNLWCNNYDDRVISFAIKINYSDCAITYSMIGHVDDLSSIAAVFVTNKFPASSNQLSNWCETIRSHIDSFSPSNQYPPISKLNNKDGVLHYKRQFIPAECITGINSENSGLYVKLSLGADEIKYLSKHNIMATSLYSVKSSICSSCGNPYEYCKCIKFLNPSCANCIDSADFLGAFWTTRQA